MSRGNRPVQGQDVSVLGILSLVLGVIGVVISFFPCVGWFVALPFALVGLILGFIGLFVARGYNQGIGLPIAGTSFSGLAVLICAAWVVLFGLIGFRASQEAKRLEQERQQEEALVRSAPGTPVTAENLVKEYDEDEQAADARYKGKVLDVTGTVQRVDFFPTVSLKSGNQGDSVSCRILNEQEMAARALVPGAKVRVRGICEGKTAFSVSLKSCIISK
jgi:hypothetical protein